MRALPVMMTVALVALAFAGCLEEDALPKERRLGKNAISEKEKIPGPNNAHPAYGYPVYLPENGTLADHWKLPARKELPDPIRGLQSVLHVEGASQGQGIALFSTYAIAGRQAAQGPFNVIDISDPAKAKIVGTTQVPVRDADTIAYPDGRLVVITTAGGRVQFATDITDPTQPTKIAEIQTPHGNHNLAVVPGTPIVYNSGSGGIVDIVDWTYPDSPRVAGEFNNGNGCHDITFYISVAQAKYRAYCAAYPESEIWDVTDPTQPKLIIAIPFPTMERALPTPGLPETAVFPLSFSHLAMVNHDASVLIVGDETGGGAINGCDAHVDAAGRTVGGPLGDLWFYDIRNETSPVLHGQISPSFVDGLGGSCTAHFGRVIEDTNFLVMGFYAAGVVLVDFRDLDSPKIVDRFDPVPDGGSIWDVWYSEGYLFTGDTSRGMDVLTFR